MDTEALSRPIYGEKPVGHTRLVERVARILCTRDAREECQLFRIETGEISLVYAMIYECAPVYFIKIGPTEMPLSLHREATAMYRIHEKIKELYTIPQLVGYAKTIDEEVLITRALPGTPLAISQVSLLDIKTSIREYINVTTEISEIVSVEGAGWLDPWARKGIWSNWKTFLVEHSKRLSGLVRFSIADRIRSIVQYYDSSNLDSGLIHGDSKLSNILVRKVAGKVHLSGIVDWQCCLAGPIEYNVGMGFARYLISDPDIAWTYVEGFEMRRILPNALVYSLLEIEYLLQRKQHPPVSHFEQAIVRMLDYSDILR